MILTILIQLVCALSAHAEPAREAGITIAGESVTPAETKRNDLLRSNFFALYYNQALPVESARSLNTVLPGFFLVLRGKTFGTDVRFEDSIIRPSLDNAVLLYPAGFLIEKGRMRLHRSVLDASVFYRAILSDDAGLDAGAGIRREERKSSSAVFAPGYQSGGTYRAADSLETAVLRGPEARIAFHVKTRSPELRVRVSFFDVSGITSIRKNIYNQTQASLLAAASGRSPVLSRRGWTLSPEAVFDVGSLRVGAGFQIERASVITKNYAPYMLYLSGPADPAQIMAQTFQYGFIPAMIERTLYAKKITEERRTVFTSISAGF